MKKISLVSAIDLVHSSNIKISDGKPGPGFEKASFRFGRVSGFKKFTKTASS